MGVWAECKGDELKQADLDIKRNEASNSLVTSMIKTMMQQDKTASGVNSFLCEIVEKYLRWLYYNYKF